LHNFARFHLASLQGETLRNRTTNMKMRRKSQGFTLIELLVVVAIIGILAGLIAVSTGNSRVRARDSRRLADLRQIPSAQEFIMNDDGSYVQSELLVGEIPAAVNAAGKQYLAGLTDPVNDAVYKYVWIANNASCGAIPVGKYYCALAKMAETGDCAAGETRYFVVNNKGAKEICASTDYVLNPPACAQCLAF